MGGEPKDLSSAEEQGLDRPGLDREAVAALYLEHADELRRMLLGLLRDGPLVADALQLAFLKAMECGGEVRDESRKTWLFRVAYNEAMAVHRRSATAQRARERLATGRLAWSVVEETADEAPADRQSPVNRAIRSEDQARVRAALETLSDEQLKIVRMRIYEEKTFAQIAQELEIPLGTALTRMRAALARLRARLEGR